MKKVSIILTAYKEAESIQRALSYICDPALSGYSGELEVMQISPDKETREAGKSYIDDLGNSSITFIQLDDSRENGTGLGKPHALNKGLKQASGEILVLTDGDVNFTENTLNNLLENFQQEAMDAACGRVLSLNNRTSFMGYISHLMTEAAHHKRRVELLGIRDGKGTKITIKTQFFPLSGYILIFDRKNLENALGEPLVFPPDCLVEDAYLSYVAFNSGLKLGYIEDAEVVVKFPTHLNDYIKQKKRSTGGYIQLWEYDVVKKSTNSRSFWQELRYFWFPLKYAKSPREMIWSLGFYPVRLYLWMLIWWERKIIKKDFVSTWVRIESTK